MKQYEAELQPELEMNWFFSVFMCFFLTSRLLVRCGWLNIHAQSHWCRHSFHNLRGRHDFNFLLCVKFQSTNERRHHCVAALYHNNRSTPSAPLGYKQSRCGKTLESCVDPQSDKYSVKEHKGELISAPVCVCCNAEQRQTGLR